MSMMDDLTWRIGVILDAKLKNIDSIRQEFQVAEKAATNLEERVKQVSAAVDRLHSQGFGAQKGISEVSSAIGVLKSYGAEIQNITQQHKVAEASANQLFSKITAMQSRAGSLTERLAGKQNEQQVALGNANVARTQGASAAVIAGYQVEAAAAGRSAGGLTTALNKQEQQLVRLRQEYAQVEGQVATYKDQMKQVENATKTMNYAPSIVTSPLTGLITDNEKKIPILRNQMRNIDVIIKRSQANVASGALSQVNPALYASRAKAENQIGLLQFGKKYSMPDPMALVPASHQNAPFGQDVAAAATQSRMIDQQIAQLKRFETQQTTIGMQMRRIGSDIGFTAMRLSMVTAGIGAFFYTAATQAANFEKKMAEVNSITDYTTEGFAQAKTEVMDLFTNLPVKNIDDLTNGLYNLMSSGVKAGDSMKVLELSAKAAIAGQTDLDTASKALIGTLNAFALPMSAASDVLDKQFKLVQLGIGRYKDFQPVLGKLEVTAKAAGQSIATTYGTLAQLTRMGFTPRMGAMSEQRFMADMISKRGKIKTELGIDTVDVNTGRPKELLVFMAELQKRVQEGKVSLEGIQKALGNMNSVRFVQAFLSQFGQFKELINETANSAGAWESAYKKAVDNTADRIQLLKNQWNAAMITIGGSPAVKAATLGLITGLKSAVDFMRSGNGAIANFAASILLITGGFTGLSAAVLTGTAGLARFVGMFASVKGAAATLQIAKIAFGLSSVVGVTDVVTGKVMAANAGLQGLGLTAAGTAGAVSMLRVGLVALGIALVAYGVKAFIDYLTSGTREALKQADATAVLADKILALGVVTDKSSASFKSQQDAMNDLRKTVPELVALYDSGALSMTEFGQRAKAAAAEMKQLAKERQWGAPGSNGDWRNSIEGWWNRGMLGAQMEGIPAPAPAELPETGTISKATAKIGIHDTLVETYKGLKDAGDILGKAQDSWQKALEKSGGNTKAAKELMQKEADKVQDEINAVKNRMMTYDMSLYPFYKAPLKKEDTQQLKNLQIQKAAIESGGGISKANLTDIMTQYISRQENDLTGFFKAMGTDYSTILRDVMANVAPGKDILSAADLVEIKKALIERLKQLGMPERTLKALAKDLEKVTKEELTRTANAKSLTAIMDTITKECVDNIAKTIAAAGELAIQEMQGKNKEFSKVLGESAKQASAKGGTISDIVEYAQGSSVKPGTIPHRSDAWMRQEAKKTVNAGLTKENPSIMAGDIVINLNTGANGIRQLNGNILTNNGETTLQDLLGMTKEGGYNPYTTVQGGLNEGTFLQKGYAGMAQAMPEKDIEARNMKATAYLNTMRQIRKESRQAELESQMAEMRNVPFGANYDARKQEADYQAQRLQIKMSHDMDVQARKEQLEDQRVSGKLDDAQMAKLKAEASKTEIAKEAATYQELETLAREHARTMINLAMDEAMAREQYFNGLQQTQLKAAQEYTNLTARTQVEQVQAIRQGYEAELGALKVGLKQQLVEREKMYQGGKISPQEYKDAGKGILDSYNKQMVNLFLNTEKTIREKMANIYQGQSQSYLDAMRAVQAYNQKVAEVSGAGVQTRIQLARQEGAIKIAALDEEHKHFLQTADDMGKTDQERTNEFIKYAAERKAAALDAIQAERELALGDWQKQAEAYNAARKSMAEARASVREGMGDSPAAAMRSKSMQGAQGAMGGLYNSKAAGVQDDLQQRIEDIRMEQEAWKANAAVHGTTAAEMSAMDQKFAADRVKAFADAAKSMRELAVNELDAYASFVQDIGGASASSMYDMAKQMDPILEQMGVSAMDRAKRLSGALKEAVASDKSTITGMMDMLDLPKEKIVQIRQNMIDHGFFFGEEQKQAEMENMKDMFDLAVGSQKRIAEAGANAIGEAFKGLIKGNLSFGEALQKIWQGFTDAAIDEFTNIYIKQPMREAMRTPQEKAMEAQLMQLSSKPYDQERKNLMGMVDAKGGFKGAADIQMQAAVLFSQSVAMMNALKAPVPPGAFNPTGLPTMQYDQWGNVIPPNVTVPGRPTAAQYPPQLSTLPEVPGGVKGLGVIPAGYAMGKTMFGGTSSRAANLPPLNCGAYAAQNMHDLYGWAGQSTRDLRNPKLATRIQSPSIEDIQPGMIAHWPPGSNHAAGHYAGIMRGPDGKLYYNEQYNQRGDAVANVRKNRPVTSDMPNEVYSLRGVNLGRDWMQGQGPVTGAPALAGVQEIPKHLQLSNVPYDKYIMDAAKKYNLDPNLIRAVVKQESHFDPNVTSSAGAGGLMQLMPGTFKGLEGPGHDVFDPKTNIDAGSKYLAELQKKYNGDLDKMLAGYNGGPRAVKALEAGRTWPGVQKYIDEVEGKKAGFAAMEDKAKSKIKAKLPTVQKTPEELLQEQMKGEGIGKAATPDVTGLADAFFQSMTQALQDANLPTKDQLENAIEILQGIRENITDMADKTTGISEADRKAAWEGRHPLTEPARPDMQQALGTDTLGQYGALPAGWTRDRNGIMVPPATAGPAAPFLTEPLQAGPLQGPMLPTTPSQLFPSWLTSPTQPQDMLFPPWGAMQPPQQQGPMQAGQVTVQTGQTTVEGQVVNEPAKPQEPGIAGVPAPGQQSIEATAAAPQQITATATQQTAVNTAAMAQMMSLNPGIPGAQGILPGMGMGGQPCGGYGQPPCPSGYGLSQGMPQQGNPYLSGGGPLDDNAQSLPSQLTDQMGNGGFGKGKQGFGKKGDGQDSLGKINAAAGKYDAAGTGIKSACGSLTGACSKLNSSVGATGYKVGGGAGQPCGGFGQPPCPPGVGGGAGGYAGWTRDRSGNMIPPERPLLQEPAGPWTPGFKSNFTGPLSVQPEMLPGLMKKYEEWQRKMFPGFEAPPGPGAGLAVPLQEYPLGPDANAARNDRIYQTPWGMATPNELEGKNPLGQPIQAQQVTVQAGQATVQGPVQQQPTPQEQQPPVPVSPTQQGIGAAVTPEQQAATLQQIGESPSQQATAAATQQTAINTGAMAQNISMMGGLPGAQGMGMMPGMGVGGIPPYQQQQVNPYLTNNYGGVGCGGYGQPPCPGGYGISQGMPQQGVGGYNGTGNPYLSGGSPGYDNAQSLPEQLNSQMNQGGNFGKGKGDGNFGKKGQGNASLGKIDSSAGGLNKSCGSLNTSCAGLNSACGNINSACAKLNSSVGSAGYGTGLGFGGQPTGGTPGTPGFGQPYGGSYEAGPGPVAQSFDGGFNDIYGNSWIGNAGDYNIPGPPAQQFGGGFNDIYGNSWMGTPSAYGYSGGAAGYGPGTIGGLAGGCGGGGKGLNDLAGGQGGFGKKGGGQGFGKKGQGNASLGKIDSSAGGLNSSCAGLNAACGNLNSACAKLNASPGLTGQNQGLFGAQPGTPGFGQPYGGSYEAGPGPVAQNYGGGFNDIYGNSWVGTAGDYGIPGTPAQGFGSGNLVGFNDVNGDSWMGTPGSYGYNGNYGTGYGPGAIGGLAGGCGGGGKGLNDLASQGGFGKKGGQQGFGKKGQGSASLGKIDSSCGGLNASSTGLNAACGSLNTAAQNLSAASAGMGAGGGRPGALGQQFEGGFNDVNGNSWVGTPGDYPGPVAQQFNGGFNDTSGNSWVGTPGDYGYTSGGYQPYGMPGYFGGSAGGLGGCAGLGGIGKGGAGGFGKKGGQGGMDAVKGGGGGGFGKKGGAGAQGGMGAVVGPPGHDFAMGGSPAGGAGAAGAGNFGKKGGAGNMGLAGGMGVDPGAMQSAQRAAGSFGGGGGAASAMTAAAGGGGFGKGGGGGAKGGGGAGGAGGGGMGSLMYGVGAFGQGMQEGFTAPSAIGTLMTGMMMGGPMGAGLGLLFLGLGAMFGKGKKKKQEAPKWELDKKGEFGMIKEPEDVMWATKKYVRRASEGGREGLPYNLGRTPTWWEQAGVIKTQSNIQFARIEIVGVSDPREAGREFVAGMTEAPSAVLAAGLNNGSSVR
jgi:hypothetical protein